MIQGRVNPAAGALGLAIMVVSAFAPGWAAGGDPALAPPGEPASAAMLPGWLEGQDPGRWAKGVALVGTHPLGSSPQAGRVRVLAPVGGESRPSTADSELVTWLHEALPRTLVVCVPVAAGAQPCEVARAVRLALSSDPALIALRGDLVRGEPAGASPELNEAIADCWRADSLTLTVIGPSERPPAAVGLLTVRVADLHGTRAAEGGEPSELILPRGRLEDGAIDPGGENAPRAGTGYLVLSLAAMPVEGPAALLERAARIGLTGPLRRRSGGEGPTVREVDVRAAFDPRGTRFRIGSQSFDWDERVGELGLSRMVPTPRGRNTVRDNVRRVLTGPLGSVKVRWLAAVALLADARPVLFAPSKDQGVFSLEPGPRHVGQDAPEFLGRLLSALTPPGRSPLFHVVVP